MNRDNTPTFNVNSKVRNFGDFCNTWEEEKEKLKKVKRSYVRDRFDVREVDGTKVFVLWRSRV